MHPIQLYDTAMIPGDAVDRRAPISLNSGRPLFVSTTDLERNDSEETIVPGTPKASISLGDQYIPDSFTSMSELCQLVDRQSLTLQTLAANVRPLSKIAQGGVCTPEHHMPASPSDKTFLLLLATPIAPAICLHACEADEKTMSILQQAVEHTWSRGVPNSNFPDEQTSTSGRAMASIYSDLRRRFPHPQSQHVPVKMQKWVQRAHNNCYDEERITVKGVMDAESRFQILNRRSELYRQYASRIASYASDIISRSIAAGRGRLRDGYGSQDEDDELANMV
ncbi:hypothetical protein PLEOSDRAFT_160499 [Pleurotus ostreatus PC15]|uniref:Uncharacterized protein n=1 Tax=Pleurotus ostreatus (strain PC15) TaxID=1137138 RepID=A0A067NP76_PLEO1|nr:hypothetical protein PLEOSDRAFT_160499 [Pleurotus ostreatus PC15]